MSDLNVIRIPIPTPTLFPHTTTNSYLIGNNIDSILVDAGYDSGETKERLEKVRTKYNLATPKRIILTHAHPDHAPGVRTLTHWSPTVYCHVEEKEEILSAISPWDKTKVVADGDTVKVAGEDIKVLHTPGHTTGHLSLYIPSQEILLAGDNVVAEGTTWIGAPDGDMKDYLETLQRLRDLKMSKIGPGHGNWVLQPYEHIDFVINRRIEREKQIQSLLQTHRKLSSTKLTKMIYQNSIHPSVFQVAKKTIEAHLDKLMQEDHIRYIDSEFHYISTDL